jgi:hypothetical protein
MPEPKRKPACTPAKFDNETCISIHAIASEAVVGLPHAEWFVAFADWRVRWLYANNHDWRRKLRSDDPRDFVETWVGHWAQAFAKCPESYMHDMANQSRWSTDPEWIDGGPLTILAIV